MHRSFRNSSSFIFSATRNPPFLGLLRHSMIYCDLSTIKLSLSRRQSAIAIALNAINQFPQSTPYPSLLLLFFSFFAPGKQPVARQTNRKTCETADRRFRWPEYYARLKWTVKASRARSFTFGRSHRNGHFSSFSFLSVARASQLSGELIIAATFGHRLFLSHIDQTTNCIFRCFTALIPRWRRGWHTHCSGFD